ncbi:MAG: glycosyltransferase [bacterium]
MKHILVIPSWYPPYDGGSFFRKRWEEMKSRGWKVGIVYVEQRSVRNLNVKSLFTSFFKVTANNENGLFVIRMHAWSLPKLARLQQKLWVILMMKLVKRYINEKGKPDLMHVHSAIWGSIVGRKVKGRYNIPYVLSEHRGRFTDQTKFAKSLFQPWYDSLLKYGLENTDYILPLSKVMEPKLKSYLPKSNTKFKVIPNIVDIDFFKPSFKKKPALERRFLLVAGLTPVKGVHLLIHAFSRIIKMYPDTLLTIIGDGQDRKALEKLVSFYSLKHNVIFLGAQSHYQVKQELEQSSFLVLASLAEGHPNVSCEAMAMGVPVLTTSVVSEDIVTSDTGIIVGPDSIDELEKGLIKAIQTRGHFDSIKIRKFAIKNFSYDIVFNQIESVYNDVLKDYEN